MLWGKRARGAREQGEGLAFRWPHSPHCQACFAAGLVSLVGGFLLFSPPFRTFFPFFLFRTGSFRALSRPNWLPKLSFFLLLILLHFLCGWRSSLRAGGFAG